MNFERLEKQIKADEGFRTNAYQDTVGKWTIGYGQTFWANGDPVKEGDVISPEAALQFLRAYLWECARDCQKLYWTFNDHRPARQEVLVNMRYNLGLAGLEKFLKMNHAVDTFNFPAWAVEMKHSRWYRQVGNRSERLRQVVIEGDWP